MPFLNSLKKKSIFYKIIPHIHRVSANTDFSILTSSYEYNSIHSVLYKEINEKIYQQVKTLPQRAKKQGLTSAFYHGYKQDFFNRYKHISQMGFNKVFFEETLPKHFIKTEWGVQDKDLFKFVLSQNYNFNFIITVTSHTPFDIGKIHLNPYKKAKTQKELYLNSLNYVDEGLKYLVQNSPQDSLFIMYSDHQSEVLENTSTVLIVYDKQNPKALQKELDFKDLPNIIKTILENNANQ